MAMGYSLAVLVSVLVLACVVSSSAMIDLKTPEQASPGFSHVTNKPDVIHKRILRTFESTGNDEARANFDTIASAVVSRASKLKENTKLNFWLATRKNGVDVVNTLKLGDDIDAVLKNSKLEMLSKFVEKFNEGSIPSKQISVVGSLMEKYGDVAVMNAIERAKRVDDTSTKAVGTKLETDLLLNYEAFFKGKQYHTKTMVDALTEGFGGEHHLLRILRQAKEKELTMTKATDLETAVLNRKASNAINFGIWHTAKMNSEFFAQLEIVITNIRRLYRNNDVSMLGTLVAKYGETSVAKGLAEAKSVASTKDIATEMQTQQLNQWLKEEKSVDAVFTLLRLDQYPFAGVISSRGLDTLEQYITLFNRDKSAQESFFGIISKRFGGEDKFAIKLLDESGDGEVGHNAIALQQKLFQKWQNEGLDSVSVINKVFKVRKKATPNAKITAIAQQFKTFVENTKVRGNNVGNDKTPMRM